MRELAIWMDGRHLGTLDGSDSRNLQIAYNESWMANATSTTPVETPQHTSSSQQLLGFSFTTSTSTFVLQRPLVWVCTRQRQPFSDLTVNAPLS